MRQIKSCSNCRKPSIFQQHNRGWCSTVQGFGFMNMFGHCFTKKIDSPELITYQQKHGEL